LKKELKRLLPGGRFPEVSPQRSRIMSAVKSRGNKSTEAAFRLALVRAKLRGWRVHPKDVLGRPDFYFPNSNLVVFVDGCFWHGCPECGHIPKTNSRFWRAKIKRNILRDTDITEKLEKAGFVVQRFWEHSLKQDPARCISQVIGILQR